MATPENRSSQSNGENTSDHAGVIAHPPLIYLAGILAGLGIDVFWPAPQLSAATQYALGTVLIVSGIAIVAACGWRFGRAGTSVPTSTPTTALVTSGLYRISRNPIYIALSLVHIGIAAAVDSPWILAMLVPVLVVINIGVIVREECYLEGKFGEDYAAYRKRVRRWL